MNRFILRFRGPGSKPAEDLERIHSQKNVNVIDESSARMLLVEAPESELKTLINSMPGWVMTREQTVPLPDPRPKLRRGGKKNSNRS